MNECCVVGCKCSNRRVHKRIVDGKYYCKNHQRHFLRYGQIKEITKATPNHIIFCNGYAEVVLRDKNIHLGRYDSIEDAIESRKRAEVQYFGEMILR